MLGRAQISLSSSIYVSVLLPLPFTHNYTYVVPEGVTVHIGSLVKVSFAGRNLWGMVNAFVLVSDITLDLNKIKPITKVYNDYIVPLEFINFMNFMANYNLIPLGLILKMLLRGFAPDSISTSNKNWGYRLNYENYQKILSDKKIKITSQRQRVIDRLLDEDEIWTASQLQDVAQVNNNVIRSLLKLEILQKAKFPFTEKKCLNYGEKALTALNEEQKLVADKINAQLPEGLHNVFLLEGVTGSGKTEVYFEAVATVLELGMQSLILVPEIMLTQQFLDRFASRFGFYPAQWHSNISKSQKEHIWQSLSRGELRVIVGARSALFLPFKNLNLIVVDEEHDASYKQEENIIYNARDMAVALASKGSFSVILSSATPSIESKVNVSRNKYQHLLLKKRFSGYNLPQINIIDLKQEKILKNSFLSAPLVSAMQETYAKGEQIMLFLNRRGYAPLTLCRNCGYRYECPNCSAWLVEHKSKNNFECHHCNYSLSYSTICPSCLEKDSLLSCGYGVEKIAEEVVKLFPSARIMILSTDFQGSIAQIRKELDLITKGEVDIVIGTQMISKGHNFPLMSLVGVIDVDMGLNISDFRSSERTIQLLMQVTGRAGRGGLASKGFLQTSNKDHEVVKALSSGNLAEFYRQEIMIRQRDELPPFGRLAAIIVSSEDKNLAYDLAKNIKRCHEPQENINLFGPAEAPIFCIRNKYRYRLLLHSKLSVSIQNYINKLLSKVNRRIKGVELQVDIDPYNFL
ncbi:primosomal protein N' [Bartonella sp. DGB1]|uniref:replication restart helicase PriA n=1 Tax=Bartonella sp. DGB1 TaxID=3239807 RepID=UPI00352570AE